MADPVQQLIETRANAWEYYKEFLDSVAAEARDLSGEEVEKDSKFRADLDALDVRIDDLTKIQERAARLDTQRAAYEDTLHRDVTRDEKATTEKEAGALRAFLKGETRSFSVDIGGMTVRTDERTGAYEVRDLLQITAAAGGNTVPTAFRNQLYEYLVAESAIRQTNVTVLTTDDAQNIQVPTVTSNGTATLVGEGTAYAEADPAFGQVTLGAWDYGQLVQVSNRLLDSSGVDLIGFIARNAGGAIGRASGAHFITGTGTNQPYGVVTASAVYGGTTIGGTGTSGVPTASELITLSFGIGEAYANRGYWMMKRATEGSIRGLKDTTNQFLWQPGLTQGTPNMLLGRPVVTDPGLAATGTNAKSVIFGDFSAYFIRDVRGIQFDRSDDFAFSANLVTFRSVLQTDGDLIDQTGGALAVYQGGTA